VTAFLSWWRHLYYRTYDSSLAGKLMPFKEQAFSA
jgi:hypothetical protein